MLSHLHVFYITSYTSPNKILAKYAYFENDPYLTISFSIPGSIGLGDFDLISRTLCGNKTKL